MFCVKCGKEAIKGEVLCEEHYLEKNKLFKIKDFELEICSNCNQAKTKEGWKRKSEEEFVKNKVRENITTDYNASFDIFLKKKGKDYSVKVKGEGKIPPGEMRKKEEKNINVKVKRHLCPLCQKRRGGYYEAVIQARGKSKEEIMNDLDNFLKAGDVTKIVPVTGGYDIFIMKKAKAKRIAKQLKDKYKVKESFKLAGVKKDKKLYRNYYSVK